MKAHLDEPISLPELATVGGISVSHFTRAFRQATGSSPHAFLTDLRLRKAKALQLNNPAPLPLLAIVVSRSLLLFRGFGLLSQINAARVAALAFGAFSVASAVFMILELSQPYTGLFGFSPAGIEEVTDALDR